MKRFWRLFLWILALGLVGWVLWAVPLAETWAAIQQVGVGEWLLLIGLNFAVLMVLNGRWWLILRGLGVQVPFAALFGYRLAAFGVSYFTPGPHFGGEPIQVWLLEQEQGVPRAAAVASVALDKTIELLINFTFLAGGVLFILAAGLLDDAVGWQTAVWGLLLLAIPAGLLASLWLGKRPLSAILSPTVAQLSRLRRGVRRRWPGAQRAAKNDDPLPTDRRQGAFLLPAFQTSLALSEAQMTRVLRQAPGRIWGAFLLSLLSWVGIGLEFGLTVSFLGLDLGVSQTVLLLVAARIAILLPLPAGLGTLESSQLLGLGLLGMDTALGLSISLVIRARDVLLGGLGLGWGWWKLKQFAYPDKKMTT